MLTKREGKIRKVMVQVYEKWECHIYGGGRLRVNRESTIRWSHYS